MKFWALRVAVATVVATSWSNILRADEFDAPVNYYSRVTATTNNNLTAEELKTQLRTTVTSSSVNSAGQTVTVRAFDYSNNSGDDTSDAIAAGLDLNPNDSTRLLTIYDRSSVTRPFNNTAWNREHIWAASMLRTGSSEPTSYRDLFNLRPAVPSLNTKRDNRNFGGTLDDANANGGAGSPTQFSPGQFDRGDVARTLFYMATRYSTANSNTPGVNNLRLVATSADEQAIGSFTLGDLNAALRYHYQDLPDRFERRRNQLVYTGNGANNSLSQGNRNPYIDHPEYVWAVFGGGNNDSQITLAGGTSGGSGTTARAVKFASVIVGGTAPTLSQTLSLGKTGNAPTTYSVTATGAATSDTVGVYNAFAAGGGNRTITVGLTPTGTATAGLKSGSVTVDNTDLTTNSGVAGSGRADGDDTVDVSFVVLDHSNASFTDSADANTLNVDFGAVDINTSESIGYSLFNLLTASGYVAGLDLDSIVATGDTAVFGSGLTTFMALAGGDFEAFNATFSPTMIGTFNASYTLGVSDENLSGATNGTSLVLNLSGLAVVPEPAMLAIAAVGGLLLLNRRRTV